MEQTYFQSSYGLLRKLSTSQSFLPTQLRTAVFIEIAVHTTCTYKIEKHHYKHIIETKLKYNSFNYLFLNNLAVLSCWVIQYFSKY